MKIALIYLGRRGGGAKYSLEVAKALSVKCKVIAIISAQAWNMDEWDKTGIELIKVATYTDVRSFILSSLNVHKYLELRDRLQNLAPGVLYYPMLHFWAPLINRMLPRHPKVITLHDPVFHLGERRWVRKIFRKINVRQASRVIILSRVFIEDVKRLGMPASKIDVIPHGEFDYGQKASNKQDSNTILFFGRLTPYKGIDVLLDAFPVVKKLVPAAKLIIAGSGDMAPFQEKLATLRDVIVVNRWIEDHEISSIFNEASVLAVPYIDASQSGVIPISYVMGVPVVATKLGGLPEQVDDGVTGFLVPPRDKHALAAALAKLLLDQTLRYNMGQAGRQKAKYELSWDAVAEKVYQSCLRAVE
ncbi:MAG TPA: glycosyltransferase family 4 protein [Candidatus Limnocylindrales bacterium]|nr:glycosyltransferase family 4 protein [Candidatus Limnocylindrales bacterium]